MADQLNVVTSIAVAPFTPTTSGGLGGISYQPANPNDKNDYSYSFNSRNFYRHLVDSAEATITTNIIYHRGVTDVSGISAVADDVSSLVANAQPLTDAVYRLFDTINAGGANLSGGSTPIEDIGSNFRSAFASYFDVVDELSQLRTGKQPVLPGEAVSLSLTNIVTPPTGVIYGFKTSIAFEASVAFDSYNASLGSDLVYYGLSPSGFIAAGRGNDTLIFASGDYVVRDASGSDAYFFSSGVNEVAYSGTYSQFRVSRSGDVVQVRDQSSGDVDTLTSVERLKFADGILAFDTGAGKVAGTAYRIYQAAFDRVPDGSGLAYHINNLENGASFTRMADIFVDSAEFNSVYGTNVSNVDYIGRLYDNVLGRAGEAGGVAFWVGQLESGARTKAEVLIGFADSPENIVLTGVATQNGVFYPGDDGGF